MTALLRAVLTDRQQFDNQHTPIHYILEASPLPTSKVLGTLPQERSKLKKPPHHHTTSTVGESTRTLQQSHNARGRARGRSPPPDTCERRSAPSRVKDPGTSPGAVETIEHAQDSNGPRRT